MEERLTCEGRGTHVEEEDGTHVERRQPRERRKKKEYEEKGRPMVEWGWMVRSQ